MNRTETQTERRTPGTEPHRSLGWTDEELRGLELLRQQHRDQSNEDQS